MKKLSTKAKLLIAGAMAILIVSAVVIPVSTNIDPPVGSTSYNYNKDINTL